MSRFAAALRAAITQSGTQVVPKPNGESAYLRALKAEIELARLGRERRS